MSQHHIPGPLAHGSAVVGYDRPLNYFFGQVTHADGAIQDVGDTFEGFQTVEELAKAMQRLGVDVDRGVLDELEREREIRTPDICNRVVDHTQRPAQTIRPPSL